MRRKINRAFRRFFASAVLAAMFGAAGVAEAAEGETIPEFSLKDLDGMTFTEQTYRGKVLVLFFIGYD